MEVVLARRAQTMRFDRDTARVLQGSPIGTVYVGSIDDYVTCGQIPPAINDAWRLDFDAAPGPYELIFRGGKNPHHGILTVRIGDEIVGTVDQYSRETEYPSEDVIKWSGCSESGPHSLHCAVESCRQAAVGHRYWICLTEIELRPCEA